MHSWQYQMSPLKVSLQSVNLVWTSQPGNRQTHYCYYGTAEHLSGTCATYAWVKRTFVSWMVIFNTSSPSLRSGAGWGRRHSYFLSTGVCLNFSHRRCRWLMHRARARVVKGDTGAVRRSCARWRTQRQREGNGARDASVDRFSPFYYPLVDTYQSFSRYIYKELFSNKYLGHLSTGGWREQFPRLPSFNLGTQNSARARCTLEVLDVIAEDPTSSLPSMWKKPLNASVLSLLLFDLSEGCVYVRVDKGWCVMEDSTVE